ncbi:MAG TPA: hypothetical protein VNS58_26870 [Puia sp.]|nr:hypothetical protein [Puia sp.]
MNCIFTNPKHSFFVLLLLCLAATTKAQDLTNPGDYITAITKARGEMDTKYMQYLSAAAHSRRARKVEKLRQEVLDNITDSRYKTTDLPLYKGDNSLRKGSIDYIQLCYVVFSEDYKKIVNMEELAEQSVDEMQAYLLLQQKVDEKLNQGSADLEKITKDFAAKYNVTLSTEKNALGDKMETAGKLNTYINSIYILFFKCNWEDGQMVQAMNNKKVNDVEQSRSALLQYATEGLKAMDTIKPFQGDPTLANACRQVLQFYKQTAEKDIPKLTDFYLKEEDFAKLKKSFDQKSSGSRTQEDVNNFNKAVKEVNASVSSFNQTNNQINNGRNQVLKSWEGMEKRFADEHMPHYK